MSKDNSDFFKTKNSWSIVKDKLLRCYLVPYFQKLLASNRPICYIDCFAGKGKFEDSENGSPLIALEVIDQCIQRSKKKHNARKIEVRFIEARYSDELRKNIAEQYLVSEEIGQIGIESAKFETAIKCCLENRTNQNVFLYIDPYGIKALDMKLFDSFGNYRFGTIELLINFNSFGFLRWACSIMKVNIKDDKAFKDLGDIIECTPAEMTATQQAINSLNRIAGGNYWENIVKDLKEKRINGYQAERRLSYEYKKRLKKNFRYVLDMPIRIKPGHPPKYRMIHACNHKDGCFLMAENMVRRKDELSIGIQQKGQMALFEYTSSVEGDPVTREDVEERIRYLFGWLCERADNHAKHVEYISITEFIAHFVSDFGILCDFSMIRDILAGMESRKEITVRRTSLIRKTSKTPRFWTEGNGKKVEILLRRNENEKN